MSNAQKEKQRCIRGIPQDTWDKFDAAAQRSGTDRSAVVHELIRWYLAVPGADLPQRPAPANVGASADSDEPNSGVVYVGYGEVMHKLQVLELALWQFATRRFKRATTGEQMLQKVEAWDKTELGRMWRPLSEQDHWPTSLVDMIDDLVESRNFLAHRFLVLHFLRQQSHEHIDESAEYLIDLSVRLDATLVLIEEHARNLGIAGVDDLDEETLQKLEALRPTSWADDDVEA